MAKKIAIGSDHGGFQLKETLRKKLDKDGYKVFDAGTFSEEACDYPEYGWKVAERVSKGLAAKGIVICKTGIGMSVIANKFPNVRAGLCFSEAEAESARKHNDTNVLVLAAMKTSAKEAGKILKKWLSTKAEKGRHAKRVRLIKTLEKKVFKKQ